VAAFAGKTARSPAWRRQSKNIATPEPHPLFRLVSGAVRTWEKVEPDAIAGIIPKHARAPAAPRKPKL
jgi:hypothetical protein